MSNCDNNMTNAFRLSGMMSTSLLPCQQRIKAVSRASRSVLFEQADGQREMTAFLLLAHSAVKSQPLLSSGLGHFFVGGYLGVDNIPGQRDGTR
jgi:hypothetical protein